MISKEENNKMVQVGIVLPTKKQPRWEREAGYFEEILGDLGIPYQILFSDDSSATEKKNVETLMAEGMEALIISPTNANASAIAAEEAKDAGSIIISYDRLLRNTDAVDYYVTFDGYSVGVLQGQYLIDHTVGKGVPLYIYTGAPTDNNSFLFFEGAWSVLEPKIADGTFIIANSRIAEGYVGRDKLLREDILNILSETTTNWDNDTTKNLVEKNLAEVSNDKKGEVAILAPNDMTARVIVDEFAKDENITGYVVTGQDAELESVQYIIDGKQSMTVFKDTRTLVADAVDVALEAMNGKKVEITTMYNNGVIDVPTIQTETVVVVQDNVKEELIDSGYYDASDFTGLE